MIGFEYAQGIHDNAEPDNTDACFPCQDNECEEPCSGDCCEDCLVPPCGGCSPAYRNACIRCGPTD